MPLIAVGQDRAKIDSLTKVLETSKGVNYLNTLLALASEWKYLDTDKAKGYSEDALIWARDQHKSTGESVFEIGMADAYKFNAVILSLQGNREEALREANRAIAIFEKYSDQKGLTEIYNSTGIIYDQGGDFDKALDYFNKAELAGLEWGDLDKLSSIYNNKGYVYQSLGDFGKALDYYGKGLEMAQEVGSVEGIAYAFFNIGVVYDRLGALEKSLDYLMRSLRLWEELGNKYQIANTYNSIGVIQKELGDFPKALAFYEKSLDAKLELGNKVGIANTHENIGNVYSLQSDYEKAFDHYLKALELRNETGDLPGLSRTYHDIAAAYQASGDDIQAMQYYEKSLTLKRDLGDRYGESELLLAIGTLYLKKNKTEIALTLSQNSLKTAIEIGAKEIQKLANYRLAEAFRIVNNESQAIHHYEAYIALQDSLFHETMSKQIAEMQIVYETEKKEQEIQSQHEQIALLEERDLKARNLQFALMTIGILLLLIAIVIWSRYRLKKRLAEELQIKNNEIEMKNEEIERINGQLEKRMLRAQMDPHFIFNSLNSIQHFITINDKDSALKYLSKFSKLIRQVLENSVNQYVPIVDEITLLEHYIQLEVLRLDHKFGYNISIDEDLDIYNQEIPFLLIQPYVENAIVHGLRHRNQDGYLQVNLKRDENNVICEVEDNGVGREKSREIEKNKHHHNSHGMSITSKRIELLNKRKKRKTQVNVLDLFDENKKATGTRVQIIVPLDLN